MDLKDKPFENCKSISLPGMPVLYYKPEKGQSLFGEFDIVPIDTDLIDRYFIGYKDKVYGYYSSLKALNDIHGTTQVPRVIDIKTNNIEGYKEIECAGALYRISKAEREVTSENHVYLELLDVIEECYNIFEEDVIECIRYIVKKLNLKYVEFERLFEEYSSRTVGVIKHVFA